MQSSGLPTSNQHIDSFHPLDTSNHLNKAAETLQTASSNGKKVYLVGKGSALELKAMGRVEALKAWITPGVKVHLVSSEMLLQLHQNSNVPPKIQSASKFFKPSENTKKLFDRHVNYWKGEGPAPLGPTNKLENMAKAVGRPTSESTPSSQVTATLLQQKDTKSSGKYAAPAFHLSNMDSNMVKGGRVGFAVRKMDGADRVVVNFQLTQTGKAKFEEGVKKLRSANVFAKFGELRSVKLKMGKFEYFSTEGGECSTKHKGNLDVGKAHVIDIKGVGRVIVGQQKPPHHALNGEVNVILDPGVDVNEAGKVLNKVFALLGVEGVVSDSTAVDT